ncbi:hypothetical protein A2U01_0042111, partial [Trifolium medium]|nr:hypothetical protein [Trifolium medium]
HKFNCSILSEISKEVKPNINMFTSSMHDRILRKLDGGAIITVDYSTS